jgi:hypothetical protein
MSWHGDHELLTQYQEGVLGEIAALSLESHLVSCESCRRRLTSDAIDEDRRNRIWDGLIDAVDRPSRRPAERVLGWLGVPAHTARLVALTPCLRPTWVVSVFTVLFLSLVASPDATDGPILFLVVAPLVPIASIAVAWGSPVDPLFEVGLATPTGGFRLLLIRTVAMLATSLAVAAGPALFLTELRWLAVWMLPALVGTVLTLIISTATTVAIAGGLVSSLWLAAVVVTELTTSTVYRVFSAPAQVAFAALALMLIAVLAVRRQAFEFLEQA